MIIYTIGFAGKSAQNFFELLKSDRVQRLIDVRINPKGQLAGFAQQRDLPYFLSSLVEGCRYVYMPELAPTKEILKDYRIDRDWVKFETRFIALMTQRRIPETLPQNEFEIFRSCLLCSEVTSEKCHRRLVAERLAAQWPNVEIIHL